MKETRKFRSLTELLDHHAALKSGKTAFTFHHFSGDQVEHLTYSELSERAKALAGFLLSQGFSSPNVLLVFSPGLKFIEVFFACLYAGLHPIPMPAPLGQKQTQRLLNVLIDSRASGILTDSRIHPKMTDSLPAEMKGRISVVNCESLVALAGARSALPDIGAETTAFIQYTSGSVGDPKGVVVSHRNILHNEHVIQQSFGHDEHTVVASWLPMFHDMGLIGNVLQPLYLGAHSVLFSPLAFVQNPLRWLELITRYRATTGGGPNFGFDHCVKNISEEQKRGLDLSSWTVAYSGAEPVRSQTIDRFSRAFAGCEFNPRAFYPCYGLAESTLFVTGVKRLEGSRTLQIDSKAYSLGKAVPTDTREGSLTLISCGRPHESQELLIVNPETKEVCADWEAGEIWLNSESRARGYWQSPALNQDIFQATLKNGSSRRTYLRTGDLGFVAEQNLYITGRLKDTIIIRGGNYYPQDIEHSLESGLGLETGSCAAFSCDVNGEERLIVMTEAKLEDREMLDRFKREATEVITRTFGLRPYEVIAIDSRLPRGSSGKLQRYLCRKLYLETLSKR